MKNYDSLHSYLINSQLSFNLKSKIHFKHDLKVITVIFFSSFIANVYCHYGHQGENTPILDQSIIQNNDTIIVSNEEDKIKKRIRACEILIKVRLSQEVVSLLKS